MRHGRLTASCRLRLAPAATPLPQQSQGVQIMPEIIKQRMFAKVEGDFVLFLIGMRINKFWKIHKWLPVALAMPKMIKELEAKPESGFLGYEAAIGNPSMMIQYWRSFDHLEAYAKDKEGEHFPAWREFNRKMKSNGDVGIWHETYQISSGGYETIYNNMPLFGLGQVGELIPATGRHEFAGQRFGRAEQK